MKKYWQNLAYLQKGSDRQQEAYCAIQVSEVMTLLAPFDPILVGTIPIEIDLPESDLDIICEVRDPIRFTNTIQEHFSDKKNFSIQEQQSRGQTVYLAHFHQSGFDFEIFGQNIPVVEQYAYRHMVIEHQILQSKGAAFREAILTLKQSGYKTEPAFAKLLQLDGDPYEALLQFELPQ